MAININLKFPFEDTVDGGVFAENNTSITAIRDNLIAFLTLKKGHRVMRGDMYSPIYDYLHEQLDDILESDLDREIRAKVQKFLPEVQIKRIKFLKKEEQNLLEIKIIFVTRELSQSEQTVTINVPVNEGK